MSDYISRALMLENLKSDLEHHANECEPLTVLIMQRFIKYVEDFPTTDMPPVKHGEWKINSDGYYPYCSVCCTAADQLTKRLTKYCPECGAKMTKGGDT